MKKNIALSTIATLALLSLVSVGCGGGGSSTSSSANTGTGYYVDNAVAGVDYVCGTQKGKTDKDGKFTFEESKECTFTLADIPLRTTPSSDLLDGKKILEDDPKVAKFLQSIDADGDLSNGIQITDEVITAVTKALKENDISTNSVPEGEDLVEVVASVGNDVPAVSGDVRTDEEVQGHLTQTQTQITKELLAGKTFYFLDDDTIKKVVINSDATTIKFGDDSETAITIEGNKIKDKDGDHYIDKVTDKYILGHDNHGEFKFYFKKSDAEAALGDSGTGSDDLKALFTGKTLYRPDYHDKKRSITPFTFNNEMTQFTVKDEANNKTFTFDITTTKDSFVFTNENVERKYTMTSHTNEYVEMDYRQNAEERVIDTYRFYFNREKATAYMNTLK